MAQPDWALHVRKSFFQDTIALVYDFDGTLSPQPMQEYTVLPKIGVEPSEFWALVNREARDTQSDPMLVYMRHIIEALERVRVDVKREDFAAMAGLIEYFPGVTTWFARMNAYVRKRSRGQAKIRHYLVSAGQKEILEGVSIRRHFKRIYASEYHFNHHGVATFPKFLVTDTLKTQFLFRINKGIEDVNESINEHMPEKDRPIPFPNIIYVGDGMTDVPSMALTKKNGGHTVAVYDRAGEKGRATCLKLLQAERVDFVAEADFRRASKLSRRVELLLDAIIADIAYRREAFHCRIEEARPRGRRGK
jgi:2-hydroxy-3-keto-5-methylthiopentenyl-1-phosphate phosphatase